LAKARYFETGDGENPEMTKRYIVTEEQLHALFQSAVHWATVSHNPDRAALEEGEP